MQLYLDSQALHGRGIETGTKGPASNVYTARKGKLRSKMFNIARQI